MPKKKPVLEPEYWTSQASRQLVTAVRNAGGGVVRVGDTKLQVMGPYGVTVIDEPQGKARNLKKEEVTAFIEKETGLRI